MPIPVKIPRILLTRDAVAGFCYHLWESPQYPVHLDGDGAVLSDWLIEHGYEPEYWVGMDQFTVHSVAWGSNIHFWFFWACPAAACEQRSPVYQVTGLPSSGLPNATWGYPTYQKAQVDQCAFLFELDTLGLLPEFTPSNR